MVDNVQLVRSILQQLGTCRCPQGAGFVDFLHASGRHDLLGISPQGVGRRNRAEALHPSLTLGRITRKDAMLCGNEPRKVALLPANLHIREQICYWAKRWLRWQELYLGCDRTRRLRFRQS